MTKAVEVTEEEGRWMCPRCKLLYPYKFEAERCECWRNSDEKKA
jgi:hypothetical protein